MLSNLYNELMAYEQISNGQYSVDGLLQAYFWTNSGPSFAIPSTERMPCEGFNYLTDCRIICDNNTMPAWDDDRRYDIEHQ